MHKIFWLMYRNLHTVFLVHMMDRSTSTFIGFFMQNIHVNTYDFLHIIHIGK